MIIQKILGNSAFWIVNKALALKVGIEAAVLLADLIDKQAYFEARGELDEEGYFYNTAKDIEKDTSLTYHQQKVGLKILYDADFINGKLKGVPARLHFKVIENKILNFLNTGIVEISNQDFKEVETNNNKLNNNKKKEQNSLSLFQSDEAQGSVSFDFPTLPEEIIKYLNDKKGGRGFEIKSPANHVEIKARIKEKKYSIDDFKKVIDHKVHQWSKDKERKQYLRPSTLFGTKFNSYLVEAEDNKNKINSSSKNYEHAPSETPDLA